MPEASMQDASAPPIALVHVEGTSLVGEVAAPPSPIGFVVIPHLEHRGPPAEAFVAMGRAFGEKRFATFVVTLASAEEAAAAESEGWLRGDIARIADRIAAAVGWAARAPQRANLPIGLFGVDTVAAGALVVAASSHPGVSAVVGCNARTDLVDRALGRITIPTLLIASSRATDVLSANRAALSEMRCQKRLVIAPGNLKESLEGRGARKVANLAARWFDRQMVRHAAAHGIR